MEHTNRGSKTGIVLAVLAAGVAFFAFSGSSKAAAPANPCQPFIDKANKLLPTAKASDIPALTELAKNARDLGCGDLADTIEKKIKDLGGKPTPVTPPAPPKPAPGVQAVILPRGTQGTLSGPDPIAFAKAHGTTIDQIAALNPKLVFGVISENLGSVRAMDCGIESPLVTNSSGIEVANPEYPKSISWHHNGQVDAATNLPVFKSGQTSKTSHRISDGGGGIDCGEHGTGVGQTFFAAGSWRFVRPWLSGEAVAIPAPASIGGDHSMHDVAVAGCIACEEPNPKDKFAEEENQLEFGNVRFGAIPFGGLQ